MLLVYTNTCACNHIATVCIPACIFTLNGVHILVFFNTESLNARATHFDVKQPRALYTYYVLAGLFSHPGMHGSL